MTTQTKLVKKHINQVNKLAWSFSKTTGQDFDDLKSEGTVALINAIRTFDVEKGYQLSTLIHISASNAMTNYCIRQKHSPAVDEPMDVKSKYACPVRRFEFMDSLKALGEEAKMIVQAIFSSPGEVLNIVADESPFKVLFDAPAEVLEALLNDSPCKVRVAIKEYMLGLGFTKEEIRLGIREIRETFVS